MKIERDVYRYIEHELYSYDRYRKEMDLETDCILHGSNCTNDGMPRGRRISDQTADKVVKIDEVTRQMAITVNGIDTAIKMLPDSYGKVFDYVYRKGCKNNYVICDSIGISHRTLQRAKNKLIEKVGIEIGAIK